MIKNTGVKIRLKTVKFNIQSFVIQDYMRR